MCVSWLEEIFSLTILPSESLPGLRNRAEDLLSECKTRLDQLPKPIAVDDTTEILARVTDFCQHLTATIDTVDFIPSNFTKSTTVGKAFVQENRASYQIFKENVRATAPDFRAFEDYRKYKKPTFYDGDESNDDSPGVESSRTNGTYDAYDSYDVRRVVGRYAPNTLKVALAASNVNIVLSGWELPNTIPFDTIR